MSKIRKDTDKQKLERVLNLVKSMLKEDEETPSTIDMLYSELVDLKRRVQRLETVALNVRDDILL